MSENTETQIQDTIEVHQKKKSTKISFLLIDYGENKMHCFF